MAFRDRTSRAVVILPYLWLAVFFALPLLMVARMSLSQSATAIPPYLPVFSLDDTIAVMRDKLALLSFDNYRTLAGDSLYGAAFLTSLRIALISTLILLLVGYPMAYAMAQAPRRWKPLLVIAVIVPFWTSFLIRVYAWIAILKPEGLLYQVLASLGLVSQPLMLHNTETAVLIGIVYTYLPFMVLPLFTTLDKLDPTLTEAARDLGAGAFAVFRRVTLPLSMPGVLAGSFLCFIPIMGEFVIPDLLGGSDTLMIGKVLWSEFFSNRDWPLAASVAMVLLLVLVGPIMAFRRIEDRREGMP